MGRNAREWLWSRSLRATLTTLATVTVTSVVATVASADELHWTHFGLRPLAMGNAFVAVADDYNSLFYNPAGLARLKDWEGEFFNPYAEISNNTIQAYPDFSKLLSSSTGDIDSVLDFLQKNTGKTEHFAAGLTPHLVFPGFGFGLGADLDASVVIHRDITADVDFGPTIIAPVAVAKSFFEDRLSVGAGVKFIVQGGINHEFSINDIQAFTSNSGSSTSGSGGTSTGPKLSDFVEGGYGVGADVGFLFTPIKTMSPTLGVSITDVGGTPFLSKFNVNGEATALPEARLPSVNAGVSLKPWEAHNMYLLTAADADAVNQPVHYSKKFNLGAEWGYGSIIKVDAGLHQGEFSGGFSFDVLLFTLRFVTYTEQLGTIAGQDPNLEDRRYALQLKLLI
jgi:opacity protein-like surface antigen